MGVVTAGVRSRGLRALALTGGILAASAVPAAAVSNGSYRGKTSQGQKMSMYVSGSQIQTFTIFWNAKCKKGYLADIETYHHHIQLSHNRWSVSGSYKAPATRGYNEYFSVKDHGKFVRNAVQGAFSGKVRVYTVPKGKTKPRFVTSCRSATITFNLRRG